MQKESGDLKLNKDEAAKLAEELSTQLRKGEILNADKVSIQLMIAGLGDTRGLLRRTFAKSLGKVGKAATPSLRKALINHPSVTVRRAAAKTLKLVGDPSALPDLLKALVNDPDPVVQGSSVGAMAIFGELAVELLLKVLIDPNSTAMQCGLATWGLAFIGDEAPEAIREAAQSKHSQIRAAAIAALGDQIQSLGDQMAQDILIASLSDPASEVRASATTLLGNINDLSSAEPLLRARLFDSSSSVRINAALSLMKRKATTSVETMRSIILTEQDPKVLRVLHLAIKQITNS